MADSGDKEGFPSDLADRFQVRMPRGLRDRIREAAEANERSMNAEIVATLSRAYPASTRASEILTDLYTLILSSSDRIKKNDLPVVHELFEELGRQVYQLEKTVPYDTPEEEHKEIDATLKVVDPNTGEEKHYAIEYKNSINYKDFAIHQLEEYLKANPNLAGGVIIVGDERLKPARTVRQLDEDASS